MSVAKKRVREAFRAAVFARDRGRCLVCGHPAVDAHHIVPREQSIDGGYVVENGASLCAACHESAEAGDISAGDLFELLKKWRALASYRVRE